MFFVVHSQTEFNFGDAYFLEQYPLYWFYYHSYQGCRYPHDTLTKIYVIYVCVVHLYFFTIYTMLHSNYSGLCWYVYIYMLIDTDT